MSGIIKMPYANLDDTNKFINNNNNNITYINYLYCVYKKIKIKSKL